MSVLYFLLSYVLVTPSLAIGTVVFLLHTLFHGQGPTQFVKDFLYVFLVAPFWIIVGILAWALVLALGFFALTRIVAWIGVIAGALASGGYLIQLGGRENFGDAMIVVTPACVGVALAAWQLMTAWSQRSSAIATVDPPGPPPTRAASTGS